MCYTPATKSGTLFDSMTMNNVYEISIYLVHTTSLFKHPFKSLLMTSKTIACSFLTLSIASLCTFTGCTKDSSPSASMTATFNDSAFAAIGPHVSATGAPETMTTITGTNLTVAGQPVAKSITINVFNHDSTYAFASAHGNSDVTIVFSSAATHGLPVFASSGQVSVTKSGNHLIQGTFSFSCTDSLGTFVAQNGQFTGTY